jgi:CHASE3 domain sensor protein
MTATAQSKGSLKAGWLFGVAIVATILIYIAWGSMSLVSRELASARAAHAQALGARETLTDLQTVLILLRDAETGERGYIITNEPVFLESFESARRALDKHLLGIEAGLVGVTEPETSARLVALAKEHLVYLNQVIELQRRGDR